MARVLGIGGVFFTSKNPKKLGAWYRKHLGVDVEAWGGASFQWSAGVKSPREAFTVWSPFPANTKYFGPKKQTWMLNFIVDDLRALMTKLKRARVRIDTKQMEESEFGRFAWVFDPEGRKLELWEPPKKKKRR